MRMTSICFTVYTQLILIKKLWRPELHLSPETFPLNTFIHSVLNRDWENIEVLSL